MILKLIKQIFKGWVGVNMKTYMADFETTTEPSYKLHGEVWVWASCLVTVDENPEVIHLSNNIDEFMSFVSKESCNVYFHNLKFDGEFILSWLFSNGYRYSKDRKAKTFDVVISDTGQWYELTVYHKVYNRKYLKTTFYDSLKKLPMKVSRIAKAFNLPESKLSIDYDEYREKGHVLTDHEKEYIIADCKIVAKALHEQLKKGLDRLTVGSDALHYFKEGLGKTGWKYLYPVLPLEYDNDIRKSYKGGWCYVNDKYRGKRLSGFSVDVNSLYPAVMYGLYGSLPYGTPKSFEGEYKPNKEYPLYIQKLSCYIKLKKDHLPTIQLKHTSLFAETEYITDSKEIIDLTLTNVDLELMLEHYEVTNIEYVNGYMYKACDTIFRPYIDYWAGIKAKATGGARQLAKLMLNSLYGKFATNPKRQGKYPEIDDEGNIRLVLGEEDIKEPVYTALASFVTSYARRYTISTAQRYYDRFIYADTDSISLVGYDVPEELELDENELGKWGHEGNFSDSLFLRTKTYMKLKDGYTEIKCAGMPENVKELVTFDNFREGNSFGGKLLPKRVKGGVVLLKTEFTIKSHKKKE